MITIGASQGGGNDVGGRGNGHRKGWAMSSCTCGCGCPSRSFHPPEEQHPMCASCRRAGHERRNGSDTGGTYLATTAVDGNPAADPVMTTTEPTFEPTGTSFVPALARVPESAPAVQPAVATDGTVTRQYDSIGTPNDNNGTVNPFMIHNSLEGVVLPDEEWNYPGVLDHIVQEYRQASPAREETVEEATEEAGEEGDDDEEEEEEEEVDGEASDDLSESDEDYDNSLKNGKGTRKSKQRKTKSNKSRSYRG